MNLNVPSMTTYPTDPASYLQRLTNGASASSTQDVLKDLIGLISQLLQQMQHGQNGQAGGMPGGAGGAGGMPGGGAGATPGGMGATPGGVGATPGGMGGAGATPGGTGGMTVQNAAGVLASYMGQHGISASDPNTMYKLATNADGGTPPTVQQAAQTMLANPGAYQQIETHDVAGTDGKSGVGNFQWAAQGGLGAAGNATGGAGGAGGVAGQPGTTGGLPGTGGFPANTSTPPTTGGLPTTGATAGFTPGTGDLLKDGKSLQMADEGKALANFNAQDGADFQAMESALSHGDGNAAAKTLANAVKSGKLSQSDAAAIGAQLQQTANAHGGGKISHEASNALSDALGGANVLTPGKTRAAVAFENITGIHTGTIAGVSTK
ncbi:hypothetical protein [Burkholderia cenocepacia]|uniref:hypothetical protein n=1 Tax=Burkholderia cenocepacia TaxID=95486 RepID=UPI002AB16629|nr:hypothetical protein [Burkholderia cenocepacia]